MRYDRNAHRVVSCLEEEKSNSGIDKSIFLRQKFKKLDPDFTYHQLIIWQDKLKADEFRKESWELSVPNFPLKNLQKELSQPNIDLINLPLYSFLIQAKIELAKPYYSREDTEFSLIDNPLKRDKVLGMPYLAASGWKGGLRAAFWQMGLSQDDSIRLFGNERGEKRQENLRKGCLYFYPTFFSSVGKEIINPHDRQYRVGKVPILYECVPPGSTGMFTLLYIPLNLKPEKVIEQVERDFKLLSEGLMLLMLDLGIGAKTSSGFGNIKERVKDGQIKVNLPQEKETEEEQLVIPPECLPYILGDGTFQIYDKKARQEKLDSKEWNSSDKKRYMRAKNAWEEYEQKSQKMLTKPDKKENGNIIRFTSLLELGEKGSAIFTKAKGGTKWSGA